MEAGPPSFSSDFPMTSPSLGFGILGSGMISPFHARAIRATAGARLIGFANRNLHSAEARSREFGVEAFADLHTMLEHPGINVVSIVTPNHLHFDAVLECAKAGKHIIVEKPPSLSLREIDRMIEVCAQAGVKISCMVNCRTRTAIGAMKGAVEEGRFGRLLHADAYMKWFRSAEYYQSNDWRKELRCGAGVTIQQGFHYLDLLQVLAGPIRAVDARMSNLQHPDVALEDTVSAFLEFESGAQGLLQASTALWPGTDVRIELNGSDGTAIMQGERLLTWKFREERPEDVEIRKIGSAAQETAATGPASLGFHEHQRVVEDMVASIAEDRPPRITLSSVRHTLEICLALYQSARTRQRVELPILDEEAAWS